MVIGSLYKEKKSRFKKSEQNLGQRFQVFQNRDPFPSLTLPAIPSSLRFLFIFSIFLQNSRLSINQILCF